MELITPAYWQDGLAHLSNDPMMAALIQKYPDSVLTSRGDVFHTLARCIVGQQVSVASADAVWSKLEQLLAEKSLAMIPEHILHLSEDEFRSCGFSRQKIAYMRNIAEFYLKEALHEVAWNTMSDDEVMRYITQIKGIGRWSAEMLLIFSLLRSDVFPLLDIGLQRAMGLHYNVVTKPFDADHALKVAQQWQPYRSVALWFLWRSIDPSEVYY